MNKFNFKSEVLKNFNPEAYHFFGLWKQGLFSECFWVSSWNKELLDKLGLEEEESGICILRDGNFFVKNSELENIKKQVYQKIDARDEFFFQNMVDVADTEYQAAFEYAQTLQEKQVTADDFSEFVRVARRVNFLWFLGAEQLSEAAQAKLSEVVVEEMFPAEHVADIIPKFETPLNEQYREVLKLKKEIGKRTLAEIQEDTMLFAKLKDHTERFAWVEVANFVGEPFTVEKLYAQITHAEEQSENETRWDQSVSEKLSFHANCLSQCGYIRQAGAEYFFMLAEKAQPYLKAIGENLGLTYAEFLMQRDAEILEALRGNIGSEELKANVKKRKSAEYVFFSGQGEEVFFAEVAEDIEILKRVMLPEADEATRELQGQVGNKGRYTGVARIIMNTDDFSKMQPGDVLVSTMTTPDFVVLMHQSGAIVTDIGGMLCHAAIVSRELRKPCVIGTKFATQVLHDGDLVEVDADAGVVRIIEG
jgi:phosphohistidine swiveling domain-containing protein